MSVLVIAFMLPPFLGVVTVVPLAAVVILTAALGYDVVVGCCHLAVRVVLSSLSTRKAGTAVDCRIHFSQLYL